MLYSMLANAATSAESTDLLDVFQGLNTLITQFQEGDLKIAFGRIGLVLLGTLMIYLGRKGVLEGLLMIPMGLGMIAVNAGMMVMPGPDFDNMHIQSQPSAVVLPADLQSAAAITDAIMGHSTISSLSKVTPSILEVGEARPVMKTEIQTLLIKPTGNFDTVSGVTALMGWLQINCMQPIYTFTFSNGLIACFVFMGIGALLDVGYVLARPFQSMFVALCAEAGTILTLPIAMACGLPITQAASVAMVGCADGPMVLFTALQLSPSLFAPITVVAYLYLGLCYGGYPYILKWLIPAKLRALPTIPDVTVELSSSEKLAFVVLANFVLCFLFPVAAPLFLSLFIGIATKEAELKDFHDLLSGPVLYFSTLILGLLLGLLCDANVMLSDEVMVILGLGILALLISGLGGIGGGYLMYFLSGRKFNPVIGIAGVSCVPTCAKVAQKTISKANPGVNAMPQALGINISGVITSAIICGIYVALLKKFFLAGVV